MGDTIKIGNLDISSFKVGGVDCSIYLGDVKLYPQTNLPYDAEIEYLQGDGSSYIDTNIIPSYHETGGVYQYTNNADGESYICGSYNINNRYYGPKIENEKIVYRSLNGSLILAINNDFQKHTFSIYKDGNKLVDNEYNETFSSYPAVTNSLILFALKDSSSVIVNYSTARIYSLYVKSIANNDYVLDLIPVRIGTTGYMYDKVSGQLFGNSGSGNFVLGTDKSS